jgi:hypothetical protein
MRSACRAVLPTRVLCGGVPCRAVARTPLFSAATMGCGRHAASHAEREKDRRSHLIWECDTRRGRAQRTGGTAGNSMGGNSVRRAREESSSGTPGGRTASTGRTCTRAECGGPPHRRLDVRSPERRAHPLARKCAVSECAGHHTAQASTPGSSLEALR